MAQILLKLKAKHFKDSYFLDCRRCPIANAAKDQFNTNLASEHTNYLVLDQFGKPDEMYLHLPYDGFDFVKDLKLAEAFGYNNTVIRSISLTRGIKF